ncbi:MAG: cyclic nucleotide-binding domain-containing protein [Myxococcales bacterium]|nr:cyclic nucleotide-binding domain-containing protein [Myxococcales bacterium]
MTAYEVRLATDEADRAAAYRLRYELYVETQGLFHDVADHERRWLRDALDAHAALWVARVGGEVVGTARIIVGGPDRFDAETRETFDIEAFTSVVAPEQIAVASRLLVLPQHRGGVLPVLLIGAGWAWGIERGVEVVLGECEPHLLNTWLRLGFRPHGLCEHPINGTLVRLAFVMGDREHAEALDSPLAPHLRAYQGEPALAERILGVLQHSRAVVSEADATTDFWRTVEHTLARQELAQRLGALTDEELEALLDEGHALDCEPGAMLIRKGHVSRTLYVLLAGSLIVRDEGETIVELTEPGEILGEVAFFIGGERMSDVLAGPSGARVLALSERSLKRVVQTHGTGAAKFLMALTQGLCHKLRQRARRPSEALTLLGLQPVEPVEPEPEPGA